MLLSRIFLIRKEHRCRSLSASGRKRSSQNARCHGLARPVSSADFEAQIETLARQIAEDSVDPARLALARIASEAELELSQVRQVRKAK
jgi:hypothetical protein